jgi:hypothetical protein
MEETMQDDLSNFLALLLAVQAGVGVISNPRMATTAYAGIKIGGAVSTRYLPNGNRRSAGCRSATGAMVTRA